MEYTDNCPNCGHQVTVEEDPTLPYGYTIRNSKGDVIMYCPKCHKKLEVVNGVMSVMQDEN